MEEMRPQHNQVAALRLEDARGPFPPVEKVTRRRSIRSPLHALVCGPHLLKVMRTKPRVMRLASPLRDRSGFSGARIESCSSFTWKLRLLATDLHFHP